MKFTTILATLSLALLATAATAQNNFAAAYCCARGPACTEARARQSGHCRSDRWMSAQSQLCQRAACEYCRPASRRSQTVCRSVPILRNCNFRGSPPPVRRTPTPPRPPSGPRSGRCTFRGRNGKVVIPLWTLPLTSSWSRQGNSITWKRGGGGGIDRAGSGTICMKIKVPKAGTYYMTATSSAPHGTEHNDAWFMFKSPGVDLYRPVTGSFRSGGTGWFKGFQNLGGNRRADYVSTIDHNGHQFITRSLSTSQTYEACISGRSSRYTMYQLVFVHCNGRNDCSRFNNRIKQEMRSLPSSPCQ